MVAKQDGAVVVGAARGDLDPLRAAGPDAQRERGGRDRDADDLRASAHAGEDHNGPPPMRTITHRTVRCLAPIAAVLMLTGCGGARAVVVNGSVLRLRLDEFRITPQLVQVHPGRLKIVVYNTGQLTHNLKIELDHRDSGGQPVVLGGT